MTPITATSAAVARSAALPLGGAQVAIVWLLTKAKLHTKCATQSFVSNTQ